MTLNDLEWSCYVKYYGFMQAFLAPVYAVALGPHQVILNIIGVAKGLTV